MRPRAAWIGLLLLAGQLNANQDYRFLEVTRRPSWEPSIADSGEIVFLALSSRGVPNAFSSQSGQLTFSDTGLLRFPNVGPDSKLSYADWERSNAAFQVWLQEQERPLAARGNQPSISSIGEVCFVGHDDTGPGIWSSIRGLLLRLELDITTSCDINASGEVVYRGFDEEGRFQIFSTERGQLTTGDRGLIGSPVIDDTGRVFFVESAELHSLETGQITNTRGGVGFSVDVNNKGDIVFPLWRRNDFRIVLATQFADRYSQFRQIEQVLEWTGPDLEIEIAIAPARDRLELPGRRLSTVPVVLFSTQTERLESVDFNAEEVDELSVRFGPASASIVVRSMAQRYDVDSDGDIDLVLWFRTDSTGIRCKQQRASIFGKLRSGHGFVGRAEIEQPLC